MGIFSIIGNLLGVGKTFIEGKQKLKQAKQEQDFAIVNAETKAIVDRIMSQTESDSEIDMITNRNKKHTLKDEFVTYLFLIPVLIATLTPFVIAYQNNDFVSLNKYVRDSYMSLNELPDWHRYIMFAIVVDVLGFRSFVRKIADKFIETKFSKSKESKEKIK